MELELVQVLLVEDNAGDAYLFRKALEEAELNVALTVIDDGYRRWLLSGANGNMPATRYPISSFSI